MIPILNNGDKVLYAPDLKGARWQRGTIVENNFDDDTDVKIYNIKDDNDEIWPIVADSKWVFPYEDYMIYYVGKKVRSNDPRIVPDEFIIR